VADAHVVPGLGPRQIRRVGQVSQPARETLRGVGVDFTPKIKKGDGSLTAVANLSVTDHHAFLQVR